MSDEDNDREELGISNDNRVLKVGQTFPLPKTLQLRDDNINDKEFQEEEEPKVPRVRGKKSNW